LHERDILIPFGRTPPEEPDEIVPVFTYALALAGRMMGDDADVEVAGVRLVASAENGGISAILPGSAVDVTPFRPDLGVRSVIDAMAGRGDADAALARFDDATGDRLLALARLFRSNN